MTKDYKVLYRKYRPATFDEVLGQNTTINILKESVSNAKISHAYIFSGPRGTGKTSTAKIFAKAINCLELKKGNPCNKCEKCINYLQSSDIYEIDAASNNGVDQIREIIDNIKLAPLNSKYKVYIVDEVHMLSPSAFNALLLTLEEPPSHVVFVLATTNVESVPITILSRCQRLDFRRIADETIAKQILKVAKSEKIKITDDAIEQISKYSDGALRDALSMLDQMSKITKEITEEDVLKTVGIVSKKEIKNLFNSVEDNNIDEVRKFIKKVKSLAADYKMVCKNMIDSIKEKAIEIKISNDIKRLEYEDYKKMAFDIASTLYKANVGLDSYDLLELILIDNIDFEKNMRKEEKKETIKTSVTKTTEEREKKQKYIKTLVDIRVNNCFVDAKKTRLAKAKEQWYNFVNESTSKKMKSLLSDSEIVLASDIILVIKTEIQDIVDEINENIEEITTKFNKKNDSILNFIAISSVRWEMEVKKYKENIKNKIKYNMIEEPKKKEDLIDNVFDDKIVEMR